MNLKEKVTFLLSVLLKDYNGIFLIDLKVSDNNSIKIILDSDDEVNVEQCIQISREIEKSLNLDGLIFSLTVASAGVGNTLKFPRQYAKNIGRKIEIILCDGQIFIGELTKVNESSIDIEWKHRERKIIGKGKITVTKNKTIMFNQINRSKVMIKF